MLRYHNEKGGRLAAICAAPSILGRLGLLKGKKAMCFPGFEKYLEGAEVVSAPARVVTDGNITTSRGMGTSIDLGLELVRLIKGENVAASLATLTQYK
jgi:4-methyl-5(b-hydroxyethyl)-thiazole monophosphate biosynthesis